MTGSVGVLHEVRHVLEDAITRLGDDDRGARLVAARQRLDEPLRIAIAGQLKAGKSTLLNALVGEELAATDAGECTKVVTWYRAGTSRGVTVRFRDGMEEPVPFERTERGLTFDLDQRGAFEVDSVHVTWPSSALSSMTLIDTPGIGSSTEEVSARSEELLTGSRGSDPPADAVVYLMRHMHSTDLRFLEAFRDTRVSRATPTTTIVALARADEIGAGSLDAMASAERIARRYAADPKLRRLAATALPVAALIAQAGVSLRERDHRLLASIAQLDPAEREAVLLSVDRFADAEIGDGADRRHLLDRLGLFGIRLAVTWITEDRVRSASELARALSEHSGLPRLRSELVRHFGDRHDILKAQSALAALEPIGQELLVAGDPWLAREVEQILTNAHVFREVELASTLRAGIVPASAQELSDMERLVGLHGMSSVDRLGLEGGADDGAVRIAAQQQLARWRRRAENPMSARPLVDAARVLIRTCEGLLGSAGQRG